MKKIKNTTSRISDLLKMTQRQQSLEKKVA